MSVALLGLVLAVGIVPMAKAAPQFASIVLNVGATASERNLVWYSDATGAQAAELSVKGDDSTIRTFETVRSGVSNDVGLTFHQTTRPPTWCRRATPSSTSGATDPPPPWVTSPSRT